MYKPVLPISVVILSKNEEKNIVQAIQSVQPHVAEVVVYDSASTDKTAELAVRAGARVVQFEWARTYPKKKQSSLAIEGLQNDWVLQLDADERPTAGFFSEVARMIDQPYWDEVGAVEVPIRYFFRGIELRHGVTIRKRSLVHRARVKFPVIDDLDAPGATEVEGHYQPGLLAGWKAVRATERILHQDNDSVSSWFERHNKYADWEAWLRTRPAVRTQTRNAKSRQGAIFDALPFKPLIFFVYSFILRGGFLDGSAGFDYALALTFYRWQIGVRVRERRRRP